MNPCKYFFLSFMEDVKATLKKAVKTGDACRRIVEERRFQQYAQNPGAYARSGASQCWNAVKSYSLLRGIKNFCTELAPCAKSFAENTWESITSFAKKMLEICGNRWKSFFKGLSFGEWCLFIMFGSAAVFFAVMLLTWPVISIITSYNVDATVAHGFQSAMELLSRHWDKPAYANDFGSLQNLIFFGICVVLFLFSKWSFGKIFTSIRERNQLFKSNQILKNEDNWRGFVLFILWATTLSSVWYTLIISWLDHNYNALFTFERDFLALRIVGIFLFIYAYRYATNQIIETVRSKSQLLQLAEALKKTQDGAYVLDKRVLALNSDPDGLQPLRSSLESTRDDYIWEAIEAQKETYDVYQAFFRCWGKHSQSKELKQAIAEEKALVAQSVEEMRTKVVGILDGVQKTGKRSQFEARLAKRFNSNALEFASLVYAIRTRLTTPEIAQKRGDSSFFRSVSGNADSTTVKIPEKLQPALCADNDEINNDEILWSKCADRLAGFLAKVGELQTDVQNKSEVIQRRTSEIQELLKRQYADIFQTSNYREDRDFACLYQSQIQFLVDKVETLYRDEKDYDVFKDRLRTLQTESIPFVLELAVIRLCLVEKRAERWALGFEETLELFQGLRDENLLDYERIFDSERLCEIQNEALRSSNPIVKKYETIIKHFEPDRFFNIELPFPMYASGRQSLEKPVKSSMKTLVEGNEIRNWRTATFNLMKEISRNYPNLIVARCTSHTEYKSNESEILVVIKPVFTGNTTRLNDGKKFEVRMGDSDTESDTKLNVPRTPRRREEKEGLLELAYVVLKLEIVDGQLKSIVASSGPFADPNSISRESPFYKSHDWKPGEQTGSYAYIGMTHGTNEGHSTGTSTNWGNGGGSYGENEGWSTGTSQNEMRVPEVHSVPNFSTQTGTEISQLGEKIKSCLDQIFKKCDLDVNRDYDPGAEESNNPQRANRRQYE